MGGHVVRMGKGLERAVEEYNSAVGSLESRVMVSARKFARAETAPLEWKSRNCSRSKSACEPRRVRA